MGHGFGIYIEYKYILRSTELVRARTRISFFHRESLLVVALLFLRITGSLQASTQMAIDYTTNFVRSFSESQEFVDVASCT